MFYDDAGLCIVFRHLSSFELHSVLTTYRVMLESNSLLFISNLCALDMTGAFCQHIMCLVLVIFVKVCGAEFSSSLSFFIEAAQLRGAPAHEKKNLECRSKIQKPESLRNQNTGKKKKSMNVLRTVFTKSFKIALRVPG